MPRQGMHSWRRAIIGSTRELGGPVRSGPRRGQRLIGVELGDLMKWLANPSLGAKRHFLG